MMIKKTCAALFLIICFNFLSAQNKISVSSPDKELIFRFGIEQGHPAWSVAYKNKTLAEHSTLGLTFEGNNLFGNDIETGHITISDGIEDYALPLGKNSKVHDSYKEALIPMQQRKGEKR